MIKRFTSIFTIFLLVGSFDSISVRFRDEGVSGGLVVPKTYSHLRIPTGRKIRPAVSTRYGFPATPNLTQIGFLPLTPILSSDAAGMPTPDIMFTSPANGEKSIGILSSQNGSDSSLNVTQDKIQIDSPKTKLFETDSSVQEAEFTPLPIAVDVTIQIQSIREIDEADQKIIIEIDLTVHWKDYDFLPEDTSHLSDERENITSLLRMYGGEPLSLDEFEKLWKPDIFIERVVKVTKPGLLSSPVTVRVIRPASSIVYTTRASVKVDCNMNFQYYPGDTQNCILDLRSYQNDETKMNLRWNPLPGAYLVDAESDDNFDLKLSYVAQRKKRVKDINLDDAVFDVLQMQLSMRRRMSYHIIQTYIPSAFLVFITWLSFLIPEDLVEARIGISMTTLLTLTAMFAAVRENTPIVSYVKAIDVWMVYCIFIVFATLLEFAFFVWLRNYKISRRERKLQRRLCHVPTPNNIKDTSASSISANVGNSGKWPDEISSRAAATFERTAKILNNFAFGFFVLNFLIFNLVYWPWLFVSSGHNRWEVNETLNGNPETTNDGFVDEL